MGAEVRWAQPSNRPQAAKLGSRLFQAPPPTFNQPHFRIRTDDTQGLNVDAGWTAALDTNATIDAEKIFRIRFEVEATGVKAADTFKLQYRRNGGTWTDVPVRAVAEASQTGTDETEILLSAQYVDNDATTNLLSGSSATFEAGVGLEGNLTPSITLTDEHTEYEWTLRIRNLWDNGSTRGKNADNDTFEYRVVESDGTVFAGTYVIPTITLNVPDYLIGGTAIETPKRVGPFKDTNGNLYYAVEYGEPANSDQLAMLKSTDGGRQWTVQDVANAPTSASGSDDNESMDVQQVGSVLHILTFNGGGRVRYHTFRTSDNGSPDTWGTAGQVVHTASVSPNDQDVSIGVRSDGSVVATYCTDPAGGFEMMAYRIRDTGGTWGAENILDNTASTSFGSAIVVIGVSDLAYIIYKDHTNSLLYYKTLTSGGSLSGRTQFNATGTVPQLKAIPTAYYYDDHGTEVIVAFYRRSSNMIERRFVGGVLQSERTISDGNIAANINASGAPEAAIAVRGDDIHAIYVDNVDQSLVKYDTSQAGAAYGTDSTKYDSAVTSVSNHGGNVFQHSVGNGGALVMATGIDEAGGLTGGLKYVEFTVSETVDAPYQTYLPTQRKAKEPPVNIPKARIITPPPAAAFNTVTGQASGTVRVRSASIGTVIPTIWEDGSLKRGITRIVPVKPRLSSRVVTPPTAAVAPVVTGQASGTIRVRSTAAAQNIEVAQAAGRVRVRSSADAVSIPQAMRATQAKVANQPRRARLTSRVATPPIAAVEAQATGRVRVRSANVASVVVQAAAVGRVRVRAQASGAAVTVETRVFRPRVAPATRPARLASRVVPAYTTVTAQAVGRVRVRAAAAASVVEQAQAVGRVRVRATADAAAIPNAMGPLRAKVANAPARARLTTRIQDVRPPAGVQNAQASGTVRIRSTAAASVIVAAQAQGRVRVRAAATGAPIKFAQATGRVRVRASADAVSIPPVYAPIRGRTNQPQRARLTGRIYDVRPPAGVTFGAASGTIRVRSTVAASVISQAQAVGRVRVRSTADGTSVPTPLRAIRSRANQPTRARLSARIMPPTAPVVTAQASGTVRIRSTAVGRQVRFATASGKVRVRASAVGTNISRGAATGRVRVRSSATSTKFAIARAHGRIKLRQRVVTEVIGAGTILGIAKGRFRLRSKTVPFVFDGYPRWPQDSDPDQWPQTGDPDRWPQSSSNHAAINSKSIAINDKHWDINAVDDGDEWEQGTADRWPQGNSTGGW